MILSVLITVHVRLDFPYCESIIVTLSFVDAAWMLCQLWVRLNYETKLHSSRPALFKMLIFCDIVVGIPYAQYVDFIRSHILSIWAPRKY